jgi:hypothetical protein
MGEDSNQAPSVIPMLTTLDEHNFYTAQQGNLTVNYLQLNGRLSSIRLDLMKCVELQLAVFHCVSAHATCTVYFLNGFEAEPFVDQ